MDTTLYVDQNASQACPPEFSENLESVDFFWFKKPGDYSLNWVILKSQKMESRLFLDFLSQYRYQQKFFWGASDLLGT